MDETNPAVPATEKVWLVHVEKLLDFTNVTEITQYHDQGWYFHELDKYYSGMIRASRTFEVKADYIETYIKAIKSCTDFTVLWYEEKK